MSRIKVHNYINHHRAEVSLQGVTKAKTSNFRLQRYKRGEVYMPYITKILSDKYKQVDLFEILERQFNIDEMLVKQNGTRTFFSNDEFLLKQDAINNLISVLSDFCERYDNLYKVPICEHYHTFKIPKKSGGWRVIDAPNEELKTAQRYLKAILETQFSALYHTSAFAYIKGRSTIDALRKHQFNKSKWFVKFDFSDFFGSINKEFMMRMLSQIYPFNEVVRIKVGRELLEKALSLCFLPNNNLKNPEIGKLPQGTPISPMLTNLIMIPIDYEINKELRDLKDNYIYTRYADDIIISCAVEFDYNIIGNIIIKVLKKFDAPLYLNRKKTRYGSSSGQNWNLGLMLNKDNDITIGHKKKKIFKAMLTNFIINLKNNAYMVKHDIQVLNGHINYYKAIEPNYINYIISKYSRKFNINICRSVKICLQQL